MPHGRSDLIKTILLMEQSGDRFQKYCAASKITDNTWTMDRFNGDNPW